jgi:argininosuccinate synthase
VLQAGVQHAGRCLAGPSLSRPLLARHLVKIARIEDATAIAHGCRSRDDQRRIETAVRALHPSIKIVAPARMWDLSRTGAIEYARQRGIPVAAGIDSPYTIDANLWGRSIACGPLDDAWQEPAEDIYLLTKAIAETPDAPAYVEIEFERGVPVRINGVPMPLIELIQSLETIAGAHGIGRIDSVENRADGAKVRAVYEAPSAVALHAAHRDLQAFVTPRDLDRLCAELAMVYAEIVDDGLWYSPRREAIDAFVAKVQEQVSGVIRLRLFKSSCEVVGRSSPNAIPSAGGSAADEDAMNRRRTEN